MRPRNVFFLRFSGRHDNLGDQFIFRSLVDALLPFGVVHIRGKMPDFLGSTRPLRSGWRHRLLSAVDRFRGCATYDFCPPGGRTWTTPQQKQAPRGSGNGKSSRVRGALRMAVGISVIPAASHSWMEDYDWIAARDNASLSALRAAGIDNVVYFPDLSFLPAPRQPHPLDPTRRANVCLSFRSRIPETNQSPNYESLLSNALSAISQPLLAAATNQVKLHHQVDEDAEFVRHLSKRHNIPLHSARLTLDSFEEFYRSSQFVISNRLHCLLLGAYCGAVPIALTSRDHTKLISLFETIGWTPLLLFVEDIDELPIRLNEIQKDLPQFRRLTEKTWEAQRCLGLGILEQRFGR